MREEVINQSVLEKDALSKEANEIENINKTKMDQAEKDKDELLDLLSLIGEVLLSNGGEISRVQDTLMRIANAYGCQEVNVYIITNGIFIAINNTQSKRVVNLKHVPILPVHLGRVAQINDLSRKLSEGRYSTMDSAYDKALEISTLPFTSNLWQMTASGVGSGCFCYMLGGKVADSLTALFIGLILHLVLIVCNYYSLSKVIKNIIASSAVTLMALCSIQIGTAVLLDKVIIGGMIPLVPGVSMSMSIREFFNGDYLSGTIRLIDTLLIALSLGIGYGVIYKIWYFIIGKI